MRILAIGDVVGSNGCNYLREVLPALKKRYNIDLVIANGENSTNGNGINPLSAEHLFKSGVDVITGGNHSFKRKEIYDFLETEPNLIRPANFPENTTPGKGFCILDMLKYRVIIINLLGNIYMENVECPFKTADNIVDQYKNDIIIVDFHAEATAEKKAIGFYLNGRVSAVLGTHTHVPTADACILSKGTGYITDLGMTGVSASALGIDPDIVIQKFKTKMPIKFEYAKGKKTIDFAVLEIDEQSKKTISIERFTV